MSEIETTDAVAEQPPVSRLRHEITELRRDKVFLFSLAGAFVVFAVCVLPIVAIFVQVVGIARVLNVH